MFAQNLVFLALLAASAAQSGILRRIQGDWIVPDVVVYEDTDGVEVEESVWPVSPPEVHGSVMEDQNLLITAEPNVLVEEDPNEEDSSVWKIVLVVTILLMSLVGCLSTAYYMCVWRGGRIHYKLQKGTYSYT